MTTGTTQSRQTSTEHNTHTVYERQKQAHPCATSLKCQMIQTISPLNNCIISKLLQISCYEKSKTNISEWLQWKYRSQSSKWMQLKCICEHWKKREENWSFKHNFPSCHLHRHGYILTFEYSHLSKMTSRKMPAQSSSKRFFALKGANLFGWHQQ